jgi:hypothetical protein
VLFKSVDISDLEGCNRLSILTRGSIVAPIAVGLALGVAVVSDGEVLFGWFNSPSAANVDMAIMLVLALIAVLLPGILYVLSARQKFGRPGCDTD